ncbi:MAG: LamG domain-containing protein [Cytophagales bacterium]|nr:LamG domain-containing protein [Cytophagales bacterium]MDW8384050.1 LamG-like jellyroll fold domain-containing protein [Flammeovirgaceae bacterium]
MKTKLLTIVSLIILTNLKTIKAQNPGGIGTTNLRGWYRADAGVILSSGAVSQWNDQSPLANHATQSTAVFRPTYDSSTLNYQPVVNFNGFNQYLNLPDLLPTSSTSLSIFAVGYRPNTGGDNWGVMFFGQSDANGWIGGGYGLVSTHETNTTFGFWVNQWTNNASSSTIVGTPVLHVGNWNGITSNTLHYYANGTSLATYAYSGTVGDGGVSAIGSSGNTNYCFLGYISEIAVYDIGLSLAQHHRVSSYLALKYGLTLSTDYVNSSGATVYQTVAPYHHRIIGIARDDATALLQKQSRTFTDSTRLYISSLANNNANNTGTFSSDNQYLVIGDNNGLLYANPTTEVPSGIYSKLGREWKVTNTNFSNNFNIQVVLNSFASPSSVNPAHLRLLVDDDGDFSNASVYSTLDGIGISYANPVITISGISTSMIPTNTTRYITIGSISDSTNLGLKKVFTIHPHRLVGWFKADTGITLSGGAVSSLEDQGGFNNHSSQTNASQRPTLDSSVFNYNPALSFDGFDDHLVLPALVPSSNTQLTIFAVARQTNTNRDPWGVLFKGRTNSWGGGGYALTNLNAANTSFGFWVHTYNANFVTSGAPISQPTLLTGNWNGTTPGHLQYFQNGTSLGTDNYSGTIGGTAANSIIGGDGSTNYSFYGHIAEILVYDSGLTLTNTRQINSYLALKYGITLSHNYLSYNNNIVYTTAAPYNQNIVGLAREDSMNLLQKQSRTLDDSFRVYLASLATYNSSNTGSFSSDKQYLVIGSDNGKLHSTSMSEIPLGIFSRIGREWKVTNTNFNGTFSISITLDNHAITSVTASHLRLLVDDDGNFSNANVYSTADGITISYSAPVVTIGNISNSIIPMNSTRYFTIGSVSPFTPLPVSLLKFDASLQNNKATVYWNFFNVVDSAVLEKSYDGYHWSSVYQFNNLQSGEFEDDNLSTITYYRLRFQENQNWQFSKVVHVEKRPQENCILEEFNEEVEIFDVSGQYKGKYLLTELLQKRVFLTRGTYLLRAIDKNKTCHWKIMVE